MGIEHARACRECERECPSWADRCPTCGSLSLVHRIVIGSPAAPIATLATGARKKARRVVKDQEPPRTEPARSTA
jgi:RNA polymerase subunit RPABC4/transcription elongation factor Spt4